MKNFTTRLLAVASFLCLGLGVNAQVGTQGDNFVFRVESPAGGILSDYLNEDCGYGYAQFGADVTSEISGEIVWAYDITPDSLACDTITADLTGKIAMIRRGVCNFSLKAYYAQQAGAVAVLIVNHYADATQSGCTQIGMGAGTFGAQVTSVPAIFLCRNIGEQIDAEIKAGHAVTGRFLLPRMQEAVAAYHYATPVTQVDTLGNMGVRYINRGGEQTDVVIKADVIAPDGSIDEILTVEIPVAPAGLDTTVQFPSFKPSAVKGKFTVVYSNNKYAESRDTLYRNFVHTDYTFATDNLVNDPGGVGPSNADFQTNNFFIQSAGLCFTGDAADTKATYISFGISNIDSVYVAGGDPGANDIGVFVYDGDPDGDGTGNFGATFDEMDQNGQQIAYGVYTMEGTEQDGQILSTPIQDFIGNPYVELLPNHPYYVSLQYNGILAGSGRCVRFMNSLDEEYYAYTGLPTTPLYFGQMFTGGWSGAIVMQRLQLDGFDPLVSTKPQPLADTKILVKPNPANDLVNVDLSLDGNNKAVSVQLLDWTGRTAQFETRRNFQNGTISFDTKSLPAGMYVLWISTEEGTTMKKVAVAH